MYRIAICDNDRVSSSMLEDFVHKYKLLYVIDLLVDMYESGEEMLSNMQKEGAYDLIFLNIELTKMNGVAVGNTVLSKALELSATMGRLFTYKKGWEERKVLISDILYFESIRKEIRMVTTRGETIFYANLYDIYSELKEYRFFYSHKSYLVNYNHISYFSYDMLTMSDGEKIVIAQPRRKYVNYKANMN